ncbi:Cj0814 family flagellar-dependent secreted protein [Helicobacter apodemus]|uniref:Uncharacterized protein n=1 Tax=Helicobacter apodemus TaxID=135569 RepID=A0A2U8FF11_9HELI|nr:hypothetical protein [Helicobacter apodemus]AWI34397.1 hypothetical protein CDV25_06210 [Helicobacter apodemus]
MKISNSNVIYKIPNTESKTPKQNINTQESSDSSYPIDTKNLAIKHSLSDFIQYIPNDLTTTENKKIDIVADLLKDELLIRNAKINESQIQEVSTQDKFYDYSVDKQGYLGEDFNVAAGLPSGFKLHKSTLEEIIRIGQWNYGEWHNIFNETPISNQEVFKHIDIANTLKQYYNVFTQIMPEIKESYSIEEIEKLPKGFSDKRYMANESMLEDTEMMKAFSIMESLEDFKVTNLYDRETFKEAKVLSSQLQNIGLNLRIYELNFSAKEIKKLNFYPQKDTNFSQEALFVSFLNSQDARILGGGKTQLTEKVENHREQQRIEYIKEKSGKLSLEEINLRRQALQSPEKLKELIKFKLQDSMELLGKSKIFTPNEIAANFGGVTMDIYAFTQLGHYRSSLDSMATGIDLTMKFTKAVHNNWTISQQDIHNYTQDLYKIATNFLHQTSHSV